MEPTVLDGGMGQELRWRSGEEPSPLWSAVVIANRPELVEQVHREFIEAGADIITLASYSATPTRLRRAGCEDRFDALQMAAIDAARRARDASGRDVRIAGCLPPLSASFRPEERLPPIEARAEYERIAAIQSRHVDLMLCETLPSVEETRIATAVASASGLSVWTAMTVSENDGECLRSGEALRDAAFAAKEEGAQAVLTNCSPPEVMAAAIATLIETRLPTGAYANGFTTVAPMKRARTVAALEKRDDLGIDRYADYATAWLANGARIVGGCCEIGPAHIAAIRAMIDGRAPG